MAVERQITFAAHGHILTNANVWSPDGRRIVYDVRSDPAGERFDGERIETVDVETGEIRVLYEARNGANCGVASYSPVENRIAFILGPEHPTPDWTYGPSRRRGVIVDEARPSIAVALDAQDFASPFTPGALHGGSHVHIFSGDGQLVSFTYEDLAFPERGRTIGVTDLNRPVRVSRSHPRNVDGSYTAIVVPLGDEICRAFEDAWVGTAGYRKSDGAWQRRALAFQGHVRDDSGRTVSEVFVVDLPEDISCAAGTPRRLTFTTTRKYPGIQGPRHWLRSSPDGSRIAFLMRDNDGVVQLWTISPNGGQPRQVTHNADDIASAFTWRPDGSAIAHVMDGSVCVTDVQSGMTTRLTSACDAAAAPRPEACVFSPHGDAIAFVRPTITQCGPVNQVFVCQYGG